MTTELQQIESFLENQVAPLANKIDRHPHVLKSALEQMGDRSWLALKAPPELGELA